MESLDFTNCKEVFCEYGGSEKKKKIIYNNEEYLLKFPDPVREKNKEISYINNVYSEYLGCKIFKSIGMPVQEVLLGVYSEESTLTKEKQKIVVACKDFTSSNQKLIEFATLSNSITNIDRHFTTTIEDVYEVFHGLNYEFDKEKMIEKFWDMFVIDTLIGNIDRHLSNFGLLNEDGNLSFAPVYDCGSSLNPLLSEEEIKKCMKDETLFKDNVYNIHPVYKYKGKRHTYLEFYLENIIDLNKALLRIMPKIDMNKIIKIIDTTPYMTNLRKEFLKKAIIYRKENILDYAFKKITERIEG